MRLHVAGALLLVTFLTRTLGDEPKSPVPPPTKSPATPRLDAFGDPLPERVIARIGHARFRHEAGVRCMAVSPDGKIVASSTWNGIVRIWEADTGKLIHVWEPKLKLPEGTRWIGLQFLGKGDRLFVGESPPYIVDLATKKVVWESIVEPNPDRRQNSVSVVLSPDEKVVLEVLASGMGRAVTRITGKVVFEEKLFDFTKRQYFHTVQFVSDSKTFILSLVGEASILECSVTTGKIVQKYETGLLEAAAICSPNGRYIAAVQALNPRQPKPTDKIVIWDREKNVKLCTVERIFPNLGCLAFAADGNTIAVASSSGIHLLNTADGSEVRHFNKGSNACETLAFTADGNVLFTGDYPGQISRWEVSTGKLLPVVPLDMPEGVISLVLPFLHASGGR
jgi:WD40 repeat protein